MKNLIKPFCRGLVRSPQLTSTLLVEVGVFFQALVKLEDFNHPLCLSSTFQKFLELEAQKFFKSQGIDNTCMLYQQFLESDEHNNIRLYPTATNETLFWFWCTQIRQLRSDAIIKNLALDKETNMIVSLKNDDDSVNDDDTDGVDAEFEYPTKSLLKQTKMIRKR